MPIHDSRVKYTDFCMNLKLKGMKMKLNRFKKGMEWKRLLMEEVNGNQGMFSKGERIISVIKERRNVSHVLLSWP